MSTSEQRKPVLPPELIEALIRVGLTFERQQSVEDELDCALRGLNELLPSAVVRAEREISNAAKLHHYWRRPKPCVSGLSSWPSDIEQLERVPRLEYLFIFHMDGTIREAALNKIAGGLPSPFVFAAIAWRLNDWAAPVRKAAAGCARRTFSLTSARVIAEAAVALLARESTWGRWTNARRLLIETCARPDVAAALADVIEKKQTGAAASVLQRALQSSALDPFLEGLASSAAQPAVRAMALQPLIDGYASWPSGFAWQWIDKSMGFRRRVRTFGRRPLTLAVSRRAAIKLGASDRFAAVKNIALDGLTRYRAEIPDAKEIAAPLLNDRAASVRERAEFLLAILAEAT
jgi:hypothetical protein